MASEADIEFPTDDAFWALVELAREDWPGFEKRLRELSTPVIAGFGHMFFALEAELAGRSRRLIASEDGADDFCGWVVACGKDDYMRALADPDSLDAADVARFDREERRGASVAVRYEAEQVYHERTGEDLCPFVEPAFEPYDSEVYGPLIRGRG